MGNRKKNELRIKITKRPSFLCIFVCWAASIVAVVATVVRFPVETVSESVWEFSSSRLFVHHFFVCVSNESWPKINLTCMRVVVDNGKACTEYFHFCHFQIIFFSKFTKNAKMQTKNFALEKQQQQQMCNHCIKIGSVCTTPY